MPDMEKEEALVQLAGTVAHELNNIFTAVTGNLSLLEENLDKDSQNAGLVCAIASMSCSGCGTIPLYRDCSIWAPAKRAAGGIWQKRCSRP
jgi:signal transduction histidine kinase